MSNSALVTTGPKRFTVGSRVTFQLSPWNNGLLWAVTSATLLMTDPNGQSYSVTATVSQGAITAPWNVVNVPGTWVRAWQASDGTNLEISEPETFEVIASPGNPFLP